MKLLLSLLWIGCLMSSCCVHQQVLSDTTSPSLPDRMLPAVEKGQKVVNHKAYSLVYSESDEQPLWCAYMVTAQRMEGQVPRSNDFREDPDIATESAQLSDYKNSGYSRGHLVPAADMKWDEEAMSETFFLSNMSPQTSAFNDGVWNRVEQQVRNWAKDFDTLYVVTGPVLKGLDHPQTIGENEVTVPTYYYKAIYDPHRRQAIAFLVPHEKSKAKVSSFAITIDELERVTGIDFFPTLPDDIENQVESQLCTSCWKLK